MQTAPTSPGTIQRPSPPPATPRPAAVAPLLDLLLPGAGMFYAGRARTGLTWLVATAAGFVLGLVGLRLIGDRNYRTSALGIFVVALLTWLALRCILAFAATQERNVAL